MTLASAHAAKAEEIGHHLFFFSPTIYPTECIISAHGGYRESGDGCEVPNGVSLYFYAKKGHILLCGGAVDFIDDHENMIVQDLFVGNGRDKYSPNYILAKCQEGKSTIGETYAAIMKAVRSLRNKREFAVLTVRSRGMFPDVQVTLEMAIRDVRRYYSTIVRFHCLFCVADVNDLNPGYTKEGYQLLQ